MDDPLLVEDLAIANGIAYTIAGEGQPVILIHGIAASRFDWAHLTPALPKGRRLVSGFTLRVGRRGGGVEA